MFDPLAASFTQSPQGIQALQQLQAQGFAVPQAQAMLGAALPAAAEAMRGAARGDRRMLNLSESNYVMNFTAAAVSGLIRGEGFMGSAIDGLQGVVGGYVAQAIAARFGLPKRVAGLIGAVITPLAIDFLWDRLAAGLGGGVPAPGALPAAGAVGPSAAYPYGPPPAHAYPSAAAAPPGYGAPGAPGAYAAQGVPGGYGAPPAAAPAPRGYGYAAARTAPGGPGARGAPAPAYRGAPAYAAPSYGR
jgi:hypothetical protein